MKKYILASLVTACVSTSFAAEKLPNIVLIFADDLGYGDLSCYGATKVQTPNIDKLAAEGRRFTDAHSASAVCTPSRYALLTGQYPMRANGSRGIWGPCSPTSKLLIDTEHITIASLLKQKGYATSCFGKWHLGFGEGTTDYAKPLRPGPLQLGFDHYFGLPVVNSAPPYVYVENDRVVGMTADDPIVYLEKGERQKATPITPLELKHGSRVSNWFSGAAEAHKLYNDFSVGTTFAKKASQWIKDRDDEPFFVYMATTNIHHPCTPAPRFQGTSQCGLYGDYIHELDWMVGELMQALEAKGVADNTLVLFTSDNGGMFNENGQDAFKYGHRNNGDLLGFKFGAWEGGHRVPFIAKWPEVIPVASTSDQLICNVDMLATFAAITGQEVDVDHKLDSLNVLSALVSDPEQAARENLIVAPSRGTHLSLRKGKWMFIDAQGSGGFGGTKPGGHGFAGPAAATFTGHPNSDVVDGKVKADAPPAQLYDLEEDPNQTQNLYRDYPEVVEAMREELQAFRAAVQADAKAYRTRTEASRIPDGPSKRSICLDFESGKLEPWRIVDGSFGYLVGSRDEFFGNHGEFNKQGRFYLTTLEGSEESDTRTDRQTGLVVSPLFIAQAGKMTFRVGGGGGGKTYVALCDVDGKELKKAGGRNEHAMHKVTWELTPFAGKKLYLKVVDQSTGGWGHLTVDHFEFDGELLKNYPDHD